jgi:hypothetical protein
MYDQCAKWRARAAECQRAAEGAIEASVNEASEETKIEFLLVATELLRLADQIDKQLAGDLKLVRCSMVSLMVPAELH